MFKDSHENDGNRKEWKVEDYDKVLEHGKFGKFYRDPEMQVDGKRVWWTKDNAKHGGSEWKVFVEGKKTLTHYKDVDKYGQFIEGKHKGSTGREIEKKELVGKHVK